MMKKILLLIFVFLLVLRLLPYIKNAVPLGYDAGIYLYEFQHFPNIPDWLKTGFSPGLFIAVYPFVKLFNPESLLIPVSIISQIFLFICIYKVSKNVFNEKIALINVFLFTVSLVQYRTFWFFYVKNTFALGFLLLSYYFLNKRKFIPAFIFTMLLSFFHLPTYLIYLVTNIVISILDYNNLKFYLCIFICTIMVFLIYYFPTFNQTISPLIVPVLKTIALYKVIIMGKFTDGGGSFYSIPISFLMTIFYLPFALLGAYILRQERDKKIYLVALFITLLMVISGFYFSQRFFIPLDIFLIIFAGYGINFVFEKNKKFIDILPIYYFVLIILIISFVFKTSQPLISFKTLTEIKKFGKTKNGYVLSTSKEDNAWLLGYSNLKLIAWDFGGDNKYWQTKEWEELYLSIPIENKISNISKLPRPLYVYINDKQLTYFKKLSDNPCLTKLTPHYYGYNCKSKLVN
jgi:hypothetical protein